MGWPSNFATRVAKLWNPSLVDHQQRVRWHKGPRRCFMTICKQLQSHRCDQYYSYTLWHAIKVFVMTCKSNWHDGMMKKNWRDLWPQIDVIIYCLYCDTYMMSAMMKQKKHKCGFDESLEKTSISKSRSYICKDIILVKISCLQRSAEKLVCYIVNDKWGKSLCVFCKCKIPQKLKKSYNEWWDKLEP